jgi:uncharacterized coiled-coil protein SlyX
MNPQAMIASIDELQERINRQEYLIESQQKQILWLSESLLNSQEVTIQLIWGLFDPNTQKETMDFHIDVLLGKSSKRLPAKISTNDFPTTRQCSDLEQRVSKLENGDCSQCGLQSRVEELEAKLAHVGEIFSGKGADISETISETS